MQLLATQPSSTESVSLSAITCLETIQVRVSFIILVFQMVCEDFITFADGVQCCLSFVTHSYKTDFIKIWETSVWESALKNYNSNGDSKYALQFILL